MASLSYILSVLRGTRINLPMDMSENVRKATEIPAMYLPIVEKLEARANELRGDGAYTLEGKQKLLVAAGEQAVASVDQAAQRVLSRLASAIAVLGAKLPRLDSPDKTPVAVLLREQEIRRMLYLKPETQRYRILQAALDSGDDVTFSAFVYAPSFDPLLGDRALIDLAVMEFLRKRAPEVAVEHDFAAKLLAQMNKLTEDVKLACVEFAYGVFKGPLIHPIPTRGAVVEAIIDAERKLSNA